MGKSSSKVLTPRNVDLPTHVIRPPKEKINPRRKCLCLSLWLLVLLLVCGLVVLVAGFLLPGGQNLLGTSPGFPFETGDDPQGRMDCLESVGISLEQKTELSDLIVVGNFKEQVYRERYERDDSREVLEVRVTKNLKGRHPKREPIHYVSPPDFDSCHHAGGADSSWDEKRVFFLTKFGDFWVPRFQPLPISSKLTQVIKTLVKVDEDDEVEVEVNDGTVERPNVALSGWDYEKEGGRSKSSTTSTTVRSTTSRDNGPESSGEKGRMKWKIGRQQQHFWRVCWEKYVIGGLEEGRKMAAVMVPRIIPHPKMGERA